VPLFLLVGAVLAAVNSGEFVDQLTDPGRVGIGIFAGHVLQLLGVITALVAGSLRSGRAHGPGPGTVTSCAADTATPRHLLRCS
jgi:hypothetical protein